MSATLMHCGDFPTCVRLDFIGAETPTYTPGPDCPCAVSSQAIRRAARPMRDDDPVHPQDEHPAADGLRWAGFGPEDNKETP